MKLIPTGPLVLYLIHFDRPVSGKQHYLGSTFERLLRRRFQTHARGDGARLTSRAAKAGVAMSLVMVEGILSRQEEYARKKIGSYRRICPICKGWKTPEDFLTISTARPIHDDWTVLDWGSQR